jgi:hypothetical protein
MNRRETFSADEIALARAVPIEDEVARHGIRLQREGSNERVGPCPECGGRDRFAINVAKNIWNCRGCQRGGDVIDLIMHVDEVNFPTAVRTLIGEGSVGRSSRRTRRDNTDPEAEAKAALAIWAEASTDLGPLAISYLTRPRAEGGRGLVIPAGLAGRVLRFHGRHWWRPDGGDKPVQAPAIIGLYRDIRTDAPRAIWRRALTPDGCALGPPRFRGPKAGCAIKLTADEYVEQGLTVGEGVETVLAAMMRGFAPAWALGDAGSVERFPVLPGVEAVTICVDNDANAVGQKASATCFDRWRAAGREVWCLVPDEVDTDMADLDAGDAA